jgi:hypothetical protein
MVFGMIMRCEQAAQAGYGSEKYSVEAHRGSRERTLRICGATIAGKYERQMSGGRSRANSVKN